MPYIKQPIRKYMDRVVDTMKLVGVRADGDLNYILFKYCIDEVPMSYAKLKNYCGELRQCATEIERRLLAPYENIKIRENGDIDETS